MNTLNKGSMTWLLNRTLWPLSWTHSIQSCQLTEPWHYSNWKGKSANQAYKHQCDGFSCTGDIMCIAVSHEIYTLNFIRVFCTIVTAL